MDVRYTNIKSLLEGYKETQAAFSLETDPDTVKKTIASYKSLVDRNQVSGNERNIDWWRKQGWEKFKAFVDARSNEKSSTQVKRAKSNGNAVTIQDDAEWLVVAPFDKTASVHYGRNTDWCVAKPSDDFFNDYFFNDKVILFFFIKKANNRKWAIAFYPSEYTGRNGRVHIFDQEDSRIDESEFMADTGLDANSYLAIVDSENIQSQYQETVRKRDEIVGKGKAILNDFEGRFQDVFTSADLAAMRAMDSEKDSIEKMVYATGPDGELMRQLNSILRMYADLIQLDHIDYKLTVFPPLQPFLKNPSVIAAVSNLTKTALISYVRDEENAPELLRNMGSLPEDIQLRVIDNGKKPRSFELIPNPTDHVIELMTKSLDGIYTLCDTLEYLPKKSKYSNYGTKTAYTPAIVNALGSIPDEQIFDPLIPVMLNMVAAAWEKRIPQFERIIAYKPSAGMHYLEMFFANAHTHYPELINRIATGDFDPVERTKMILQYVQTYRKLNGDEPVRVPQFEPLMATYPHGNPFVYAMATKQRFPAGEKTLANDDPEIWETYKKKFIDNPATQAGNQ